jgi:hypothetical protein
MGFLDIISDLGVMGIFFAYCIKNGNILQDNVAMTLTIALMLSCLISIVLFGIQFQNYRLTRRLYSDLPIEQIPKEEKTRLDFRKEVIEYLILILEDLASIIIIYIAFCIGSCELFEFVFIKEFEGALIDASLFVIFLSNVIKVSKPCYKCNKSLKKSFIAIQTCSNKPKAYYLALRAVRPVWVLLLLIFTVVLYFEINYVHNGINSRPECMYNNNTIETDVITRYPDFSGDQTYSGYKTYDDVDYNKDIVNPKETVTSGDFYYPTESWS